MREEASEIDKILKTLVFDDRRLLLDTAQIFKLRTIVRKAGFDKEQGYGVAEIIPRMMLLPFLLLKSV